MIYDKRKFYIVVLVGLLLTVGVGYAYLTSNLSINGDALFKRNTMYIHWNNPTVLNGSVSGASVTQAAHVVGANSDTVEYAVTLTNPGDYYEFTVPAVNEGTIDAMVSNISNLVYLSSNTSSPISLPGYLSSTVTYSDGIMFAPNQYLKVGQTETFKVKLLYREDIDPSVLPNADKSMIFRFTVTYVQANSHAVEINHPKSFAEDDWDTIISAAQNGSTSAYTVGSTKTVMGTFGTHTLRVANNSTPAECSTAGFSQTACGFVLEFADIITTYVMNSPDTNVGGWPASELRTYVNNDIYNALPTSLKNAIIDTTVVSGHGSTSGETNFTSTDKLYLLSTKEVGFDLSYDSAKAETRILDYYNANNNNNSRIKKYNNSVYSWWLRSAASQNDSTFYFVDDTGDWRNNYAGNARGVAPAFRIG